MNTNVLLQSMLNSTVMFDRRPVYSLPKNQDLFGTCKEYDDEFG